MLLKNISTVLVTVFSFLKQNDELCEMWKWACYASASDDLWCLSHQNISSFFQQMLSICHETFRGQSTTLSQNIDFWDVLTNLKSFFFLPFCGQVSQYVASPSRLAFCNFLRKKCVSQPFRFVSWLSPSFLSHFETMQLCELPEQDNIGII